MMTGTTVKFLGKTQMSPLSNTTLKKTPIIGAVNTNTEAQAITTNNITKETSPRQPHSLPIIVNNKNITNKREDIIILTILINQLLNLTVKIIISNVMEGDKLSKMMVIITIIKLAPIILAELRVVGATPQVAAQQGPTTILILTITEDITIMKVIIKEAHQHRNIITTIIITTNNNNNIHDNKINPIKLTRNIKEVVVTQVTIIATTTNITEKVRISNIQ